MAHEGDSMQTFPCNNCSDPPAQCEYCEAPRSWKGRFEDKIERRLKHFEENYPPDFFKIVKRELRGLLGKEVKISAM